MFTNERRFRIQYASWIQGLTTFLLLSFQNLGHVAPIRVAVLSLDSLES